MKIILIIFVFILILQEMVSTDKNFIRNGKTHISESDHRPDETDLIFPANGTINISEKDHRPDETDLIFPENGTKNILENDHRPDETDLIFPLTGEPTKTNEDKKQGKYISPTQVPPVTSKENKTKTYIPTMRPQSTSAKPNKVDGEKKQEQKDKSSTDAIKENKSTKDMNAMKPQSTSTKPNISDEDMKKKEKEKPSSSEENVNEFDSDNTREDKVKSPSTINNGLRMLKPDEVSKKSEKGKEYFVVFLLVALTIAIIGYMAFQKRKKILGYLIEGKRTTRKPRSSKSKDSKLPYTLVEADDKEASGDDHKYVY